MLCLFLSSVFPDHDHERLICVRVSDLQRVRAPAAPRRHTEKICTQPESDFSLPAARRPSETQSRMSSVTRPNTVSTTPPPAPLSSALLSSTLVFSFYHTIIYRPLSGNPSPCWISLDAILGQWTKTTTTKKKKPPEKLKRKKPTRNVPAGRFQHAAQTSK